MLKNILSLEGVQQISKNEQKDISGAKVPSINCYCDGVYAGTCWSVSCCVTTCDFLSTQPFNP